jgi:uncharacterized protein
MASTGDVNERMLSGYVDLKPHIYIKESDVQGRGLFSDTDIRSGAVLFEIVGEKIRHEYDPRLAAENPNWIGTGYEEWLMLGPGDIAIFLNHSCEPNVILNENLQLIAMQPIKAHQELLLDYSTTELDPYWKMECGCGAKQCRKELRSFQFLPESLQAKYAKYLAPVFVRTAETLALNKVAS